MREVVKGGSGEGQVQREMEVENVLRMEAQNCSCLGLREPRNARIGVNGKPLFSANFSQGVVQLGFQAGIGGLLPKFPGAVW